MWFYLITKCITRVYSYKQKGLGLSSDTYSNKYILIPVFQQAHTSKPVFHPRPCDDGVAVFILAPVELHDLCVVGDGATHSRCRDGDRQIHPGIIMLTWGILEYKL